MTQESPQESPLMRGLWTALDVVKTISTAVQLVYEAIQAGVPSARVVEDLRQLAHDYGRVDDDTDRAAKGRGTP